MRPRDAIKMLADGDVGALGPTTWADLGCGAGTFTLALAELLAAGSLIHAMDRDARALRRIPALRHEVAITTQAGDFITTPWPFTGLDGILMANALHFVGDQAAFVRGCQPRVRPTHRFLIVEYDTDVSNPWVPYPVSRVRLADLFASAGYSSVRVLHTRPSVYQRAPLYSALIER